MVILAMHLFIRGCSCSFMHLRRCTSRHTWNTIIYCYTFVNKINVSCVADAQCHLSKHQNPGYAPDTTNLHSMHFPHVHLAAQLVTMPAICGTCISYSLWPGVSLGISRPGVSQQHVNIDDFCGLFHTIRWSCHALTHAYTSHIIIEE